MEKSFEAAQSDLTITSLSYDPAPIESGSLYFNLWGSGPDAIIFLQTAVSRGAVAACCEFEVPQDFPVPVIRVTNTRLAMSAAASFVNGHPSQRLEIAGITGTTGKSTICAMVARCLDYARVPHGLICSVVQKAGSECWAPTLTTPDAPEIHQSLARIVESGASHAVVEVSSHGIMHERVTDIPFKIGVCTNIHRDHLDAHPSMEHYMETKARLFTRLPPEGYALASASDQNALRVASSGSATLLTVGHDANSSIQFDERGIRMDPGLADRLGLPRMTIDFAPGVLSDPPFRSNAAFAAGVAWLMGASPKGIAEGLNTYPGLFGRNQCVFQGPFRIVHSIITCREQVLAMSEYLAQLQPWNRAVFVMSPRGNRGVEINRELGDSYVDVLRRWPLRSVIYANGDDVPLPSNRVSPKEKEAVLSALKQSGIRIHYRDFHSDAFCDALRVVRKNDILVLIGANSMWDAAVSIKQLLATRGWGWWRRQANGTWDEVDRFRNACRAVVRST